MYCTFRYIYYCSIGLIISLFTVIKFLTETGTILHFNDQLKGLNNLYFLDPTWLCDVISKVLKYVVSIIGQVSI